MPSVAFDIQNLVRRLDTMDSTGPTARNLQSAWALVQTANSLLQDLVSGGAGHFTLSEDWVEANRVAYEAAVSAAQVAITTAQQQFKILAKG
jgi:hypothetical protein